MVQRGRERQDQDRAATQQSREIDVVIRQPQHDCPLYTWDREQDRMCVTGIYHAEKGLPCQIARYVLEGIVEFPVFLITHYSFSPGTWVHARILGALQFTSSAQEGSVSSRDSWNLIATVELDSYVSFFSPSSKQRLPAQRAAIEAYLRAQRELADDTQHDTSSESLVAWDAEATVRFLRETRVQVKREQRAKTHINPWQTQMTQAQEEQPMAWHILEGLSASQRAALRERASVHDATAPHAHAEQLLRFVPQRFQQALAELLLEDERLLAFVERPLLRHRMGVLGVQTWRSNEGLFLVTDRQILWLRDFFSPGTNYLPGGFVAHSAPVERLKSITVLPAGRTPDALLTRLSESESPYFRLVMEMESSVGSEHMVIEFPQGAESEKVLAHLISLLRGFLPLAMGKDDRRLRRLPHVEAWCPQGAEAERLAGLGGIVPADVRQRLEQRLTEVLNMSGEALLVSVPVPALEEYHSPARLVALTDHGVLLLDDARDKQQHGLGKQRRQAETMRYYTLNAISSVQLRTSLVGSSLSVFIPQPTHRPSLEVIPFHSPARVWFLPLFTRLRVLLSGPSLETKKVVPN